jgi:hypothetical protein
MAMYGWMVSRGRFEIALHSAPLLTLTHRLEFEIFSERVHVRFAFLPPTAYTHKKAALPWTSLLTTFS